MNIEHANTLSQQVTIATLTLAAAALLAVPAACRAAAMYGSETGHYTVDEFTASGVGSVFAGAGYFAPPFYEPFGMAFDSVGNLFVADGYSNTIKKITPSGVVSMFASTGLSSPTGLAFDSVGNLYAANWGNNTIAQFAPDGVGSIFATMGLSCPWGLAFDKADNLFVANGVGSTIEKFTPNGGSSLFANSGLSSPFGLAFDNAGNLFVANAVSDTIEEFTPGGVGSVFANIGLNEPGGLAFDGAGNLYVASQADGKIVEFTPGGVGSTFASGLNQPTFLTIAPEPSTYALFSIGIMAILASRGRKVITVIRDSSLLPNKSRGRVKTPGQRADGRLGGWKFYSCGVDRLSEADEVTRC